MLKLICAFLMILAVGIASDAYPAGCEPGPNEITLYQHSNYEGLCSVLGVGTYRDSAALRMPNDSVSSIKIGSNVQILVLDNSLERGSTSQLDVWKQKPKWRYVEQVFTSSQSSLKGTRIGNDTISSVIVSRKTVAQSFEHGDCYPGDNSTSIAIYQHPKFEGNCRVLELGSYRNSEQMNFKNDSVSSVEFGRNSLVYAELYADSDFKGRKQILTNSVQSLHDGDVGDNKLTSIRVFRK